MPKEYGPKYCSQIPKNTDVMAINVETKKAAGSGLVKVFLLHFFIALLAAVFFLFVILLAAKELSWKVFFSYFITFIPITVVLPLILGIAAASSYKRVEIILTPASSVNLGKLKDFFLKNSYLPAAEENSGFTFKRSHTLKRALCLNSDMPTIQVNDKAVSIVMLKRKSFTLVNLLSNDKRYEVGSENAE